MLDGPLSAGVHEVNFDDGQGAGLVRGVHFVEVRSGAERITRPIVVLD